MSATSPVDTRPRPLRRRPTSTHSYSYRQRRGGCVTSREAPWGNVTEYAGTVYSGRYTVDAWAQYGDAEPFAQFRIYDGEGRVHVFNEWGAARTARGLVLRAHALAKQFARGGW